MKTVIVSEHLTILPSLSLCSLSLLHSERPKLYAILASLSAIGLNDDITKMVMKKLLRKKTNRSVQ